MVRICPVWKWFSVECRTCPLSILPLPISISSAQVYSLYSLLFHLAGMASLSPLHHCALLSEAGRKVCVCYRSVCAPAVCAGKNLQPTCALGPRANVCMMCVCGCVNARARHRVYPDVAHRSTLSTDLHYWMCTRRLMEEQCSVHSTHWGTLKLTVISSKIHCTDTHMKCCQGGAGA